MAAAQRLVQAAAVHRPVGDQVLDAGQLLEVVDERRRRQNSRGHVVERSAPGVGLDVAVLGLVDVEVALPELVVDRRELGRRSVERLGRSTSSRTMCGKGSRGRRTPWPPRPARRAAEPGRRAPGRSCAHACHGVGGTEPPRVNWRVASTPASPSEGDVEGARPVRRRPRHRPPRVGVLVVAYNAAGTLAAHPRAAARVVRARPSTTSSSATTPAPTTPTRSASAYQAASRLPLTVVRHERNLGYGGNQKAGYALGHRARPRHRRAAPRRRPVRAGGDRATSSRRSRRGEADAVFGSRMMVRGRPARAACRCTSTSATGSSPRSRTS